MVSSLSSLNSVIATLAHTHYVSPTGRTETLWEFRFNKRLRFLIVMRTLVESNESFLF